MAKGTPKDQQREELINLKFERMRTKVEVEAQQEMRKKQEDLPSGGYKQGIIRNIEFKKIRKLAEGLAAIDKEVYGDPKNEKDISRILDRVKTLVDDHINNLIRTIPERKMGPQKLEWQYKERGEGIISNIKRDPLIILKEKRLGLNLPECLKIFVIMPFSETSDDHSEQYWDKFYNRVYNLIRQKHYERIKKWFNTLDIEIYRAETPQGNMVKKILKDLKGSYIVIAILTDKNPNVFYELGIRHAQSIRTIMLCQKSQKIPFDLKNYGVGLYSDKRNRYKDIEKQLLKRLKEISENPEESDNPFSDFVLKS